MKDKKISILDDLTINKIAAGEVVEAPYSVAKELIENSIDAMASIITFEIKNGGKEYIRITDNGVGIGEKYVEKAFMRHFTSKIKNIDDLNTISSLGFRGEALASIASVAQVEMITRTREQQYGIHIQISGGKVQSYNQIGCPIGTTIIVKNIFFNTPARLKFMKSTQAETLKISEIITRLSLSNPGISFKYVNNNKIMFTTPGNKDLSQSILSIFGKDTFKNLIYLEGNKSGLSLEGYIGEPSFVRGNRNMQIIFVNGRYVKSDIVSRALEKAYKDKIIINRFPICILNLTIDPALIDINVHPAKTQIKFQNEEDVYEFVYRLIYKTLLNNTIVPKLTITSHLENDMDNIGKDNINITPKGKTSDKDKGEPIIKESKKIYHQNNNQIPIDIFIDENNKRDKSQAMPFKEEDMDIVQSSFLNSLLNQYKIIGQVFNTYIILEKDDEMYLIDQHAAHERLIYNNLLNKIKKDQVISQGLMEPKILELSNEDYLLLFEHIDIFYKIGFKIEDFGSNTAIIREVPMVLGKPKDFTFIYEILDEIRNFNFNTIDINSEDILIKKACRQAIKAKDKLDHFEIENLIKDIQSLTPPLTCPHGRPIILTMSKYEIEKHFKRIQ